MAGVYRARDIRLDRVVAIKTMRADLARDRAFQGRFRREAQSASSLNNPSIVAVYDTGEDMSTGVPVPYIVMEYVDGRTVRDLLIEGHRLLPQRALEIISGVLRALEYSHQAGIVHRDIKPGNVMVTRNGDVKVLDFGSPARSRRPGHHDADRPIAWHRILYVAGAGQGRAGGRQERPVFHRLPDVRAAHRPTTVHRRLAGGDRLPARAGEPGPPSRLDPDMPPWADAIVLRAMAKSPRTGTRAPRRCRRTSSVPPPACRWPRWPRRQPARITTATRTALSGWARRPRWGWAPRRRPCRRTSPATRTGTGTTETAAARSRRRLPLDLSQRLCIGAVGHPRRVTMHAIDANLAGDISGHL